ncbi:MAG TPA: hypothetical protein VIM60_05450 [Edaphobacter sp.]
MTLPRTTLTVLTLAVLSASALATDPTKPAATTTTKTRKHSHRGPYTAPNPFAMPSPFATRPDPTINPYLSPSTYPGSAASNSLYNGSLTARRPPIHHKK